MRNRFLFWLYSILIRYQTPQYKGFLRPEKPE